MRKCYLILMVAMAIHCNAQELPVREKLSLLSFLANGKDVPCYVRGGPVDPGKGRGIFDFFCKEGFFAPDADTVGLVYRQIASAISGYAIADSAAFYDSVIIRFISFDSTKYKGQGFLAERNVAMVSALPEVRRLEIAMGILPFAAQAQDNDDGITLFLHYIKGYSPKKDMTRYSTLLSVYLYDYVCKRKERKITIEYIDDKKKTHIDFFADLRKLDEILAGKKIFL